MHSFQSRGLVVALTCLILAACGGGGSTNSIPSSNSGANNGGDSGGNNGGSGVTQQEFFQTNLQSAGGFCRTCHIPGGVADKPEGDGLMLSSNSAEDFANFYAAWESLGKGVATNPLVVKVSDPSESHDGGQPWPVGSVAYDAMITLMSCWDNPANCSLAGGNNNGGGAEELLPLLGSSYGGHKWFDFCADDGNGNARPDSALLPPDPRALVQPGVSDGKAVHFNEYWADCHVDPVLVGERAHPKNCGELRVSWEHGRELMVGNGETGSGTFFDADYHDTDALLALSSEAYNRLWMLWGLTSRPDNFDELVAERYGMPMGDAPNPYPLDGEDPNAPGANGGSGQLPVFLTQMRGDNGEWTGTLGYTCHACHTGAAGLPGEGEDTGIQYGGGNSLQDIALMSKELGMSSAAGLTGEGFGSIFSLFGTSRGTNNASDVNIFFLANKQNRTLDQELFEVITSGSTASGDTPAWWNMGHRPVKFQDAFFPMDSSRVDLIFYTPLDALTGDAEGELWVRDHAQDADKWMVSLKSPKYPLAVNESLAEQGAVLFHSKNLWEASLNNPVPEPQGGNGSCASCHGAYSPRYVNDPNFLADPLMEGVASNVTPNDVIRTDRARVDTNNEAVNQYGADSFLGFGETVGTDNDCGPRNRAELRGDREMGYLAPPLYGVWATAPYLHNGSVPDVWSLLKPEDRPEIWRRVSTPKPAGQDTVVMGYDVSMSRAYDESKMGWKYDSLACASGTTTIPFLDCDPLGLGEPIIQQILEPLYGNLILAWNLGQVPVFTQMTPQQVEDRKIYNTNLYSQGNEGHDFTAVLTDTERRAIIEYLKTL
ncbi:hypothetical protein IB286_07705 [Spongiibacter sp. KMU-158]|uniref:Cytochrome c domain-containing protein n=1 Tax=Spongiibacter pelagi TaxID=2760804 RepID=A0A927C3E1_9GAMM|nr:hypothetical protein [Spongiibacter pelagi]MBD2858896.1 hypothetical protein [Spongiibacter pelagi]